MTAFAQVLPEQGSTLAPRTDALFYFLCAMSIVVGGFIVAMLFVLSIRYRRTTVERPPIRGQSLDAREMKRLEYTGIAISLAVFLGIFYWGAKLFVSIHTPPPDALTVYVVGKRWMWKVQHTGGQREINELHLPLGQPVKLLMTSEDVIHSFYVPAFRVKNDVLPGRYTTLWFQPSKLGSFHLFCAEYCGTKHSQMIGRVVVMPPAAYQEWLGGGSGATLAEAGEKRFNEIGCATCHRDDAQARGPQLRGLFGRRVKLKNGDEIIADESYLRESILDPRAKQVAGFEPIMPTYAAQLDEQSVLELIAHIKSLQPLGAGSGAAPEPTRGEDGAKDDGSARDAGAADGGPTP